MLVPLAATFVVADVAGAPAASLAAHQITPATAGADLFTGSDASGGIRDWYLSNGVVEAVIDNVAYQVDRFLATGAYIPVQNGQALTGGTLIDLGLVGHDNDQLTSVYPLVNANPQNPVQYVPASFALGNPALPAVLASVDETAGVASLTVHGFALLGPNPQQLTVETVYSVRTGEPFLRMRSTLRNTGTTALPLVNFGDNIQHGRGGTIPFVPCPGRGFTMPAQAGVAFYHSVLGVLAPSDGVVDTTTMTPSGEVSYTFYNEDGIYLESGDPGTTTVGRTPTGKALAPGASYVYARRIYVGDRNDAASSADFALAEMSTRWGIPMGRVHGRLVSPEGNPFRANIVAVETDVAPQTPETETLLSKLTGSFDPLPINQMSTDSTRDGVFAATVPIGRNQLWILADERDPIGPIPFEVQSSGQDIDVGDIQLSDTGRLSVHVTDTATGLAIPARLTLIGMDVPNPQFGTPIDLAGPNGQPILIGRKYSTPFANVLYTETGNGELTLSPGRYRVIASHGTGYDLAWGDAVIGAGGNVALDLAVRPAVDTTGWLAADFHIHAAPSADSSVPPADRVRSYVAEGIQVMVSADHDFLFDYRPLIQQMGLADRVASILGGEVTTVRPLGAWPDGPGHFIGWPLVQQPQSRKNGAPEDEQSEPSVIYDRLRGIGARIVQVNHPFSPGQGFLGAIGFDPTLPVSTPPNDALLRSSALGTGTKNLDFDAIEIYNGLLQSQTDQGREAWMSLLNQGFVKVATASSDSHDVSPSGPGLGPGMPRTYVAYTGTNLAAFDVASFDGALAAGKAFGSSGPILDVRADWNGNPAGLGETLGAAGCCLSLQIRVQAPCWMPVGEVRVFANGTLLLADPVATGCTSSVRYDQSIAVAPSADTYYVVEVRERLPRPPPANFDEQLGRLVYPQARFQAFTNPIFIDVDGNGHFDPPGLGAFSPAASVGTRSLLRVARNETAMPPARPSHPR